MPDIDEDFLPHHRDLLHEFESARFTQDEGTWQGTVSDGDLSWRVEISFEGSYPFRPPTVRPIGDERAPGWHQNRDRSMCLYDNTLPTWAPWFTRGDLLTRIATWCRNREEGWPDDQPDLDLQRYWPPSVQFDLAIHSPVPANCHGTRNFELVPQTRSLREVSQIMLARRSPGSRYQTALLVDIGELTAPVTTQDQLFDRVPDAAHVKKRLETNRNQLLLVRYARRGHAASLLLKAARAGDGVELRAIETAEDGLAVVDLRRGPYLAELATKKVAVVGVGAVGSFIASSLQRAGVTHLTLVDHDLLRPGNLARHAADERWVGFRKSEAMTQTLGGPPASARVDRIDSLAKARELLRANDLVIDATADEGVTTLLALAAEDTRKAILTAYLANQGRSRVVEVLHSPKDERTSTTKMEPIGVDGYEAGCGDPVSPTPLYAVQEAAAMAARVAVGLLLGDISAASELRETQ